jgi:hypothetical protein
MSISKALAVVLLMLPLSGCAEFANQWSDRYGPAPVPTALAISEAASREVAVVEALAIASGFSRGNPPQTRSHWYAIILAGFNTVDDACTTYINDLWKLDRQRGRVKDILSASAAASAAIVGAAPNPSAQTLTILAQSFGLASAITNAFADSYLYAQSPSTVRTMVKKSRDAYRDDMAKNFSNVNYPMSSSAAAYYHVREYLALCLPPTVDSQIDELVAKAKAAPEDSVAAKKVEAAKADVKAVPVVGNVKVKASTNIQFN